MITLDDISKTLLEFEKKFGFKVTGHQQLSETWFQLRLGVITASNASAAMAKPGSETRLTYMAELVAEICTGVWEEVNSKHMDWGRAHEDAARSYFEFCENIGTVPAPFVFKDDTFRVGCSPDGFVKEYPMPYEIKCPWSSANYVKFLVADSIKPEWKWQQNFNMWVLKAEKMYFCQFDPRMKKRPMKIMVTEADPDKQRAFDDLIPVFIQDMDKMLADIGLKFGDQWKRIADAEKTAGESSSGPGAPTHEPKQ